MRAPLLGADADAPSNAVDAYPGGAVEPRQSAAKTDGVLRDCRDGLGGSLGGLADLPVPDRRRLHRFPLRQQQPAGFWLHLEPSAFSAGRGLLQFSLGGAAGRHLETHRRRASGQRQPPPARILKWHAAAHCRDDATPAAPSGASEVAAGAPRFGARRHGKCGAWLPNTYFAKHAGAWPEAGGRYLLSFVLGYALGFWLLLAALWLAAATAALLRTRQREGMAHRFVSSPPSSSSTR